MPLARLCPADKAEFIECQRPFSFFELAEKRFGECAPICRIFSQARIRGAQSIVIERVFDATDILEEDEDIAALVDGFDPEESKCWRITFFREPVSEGNIKAAPDNSFIGYAIYKKDSIKARVYESVIEIGHRDNFFIRGAPIWECMAAGRLFTVSGYLYAQQNGITNSCAHVAVRTAATPFYTRDLSYREINNWVSEYQRTHGDSKQPREGLTNDEICHVLKRAGANTFVADFSQTKLPPVPYQLRLYSSVESGFPGIVFFGTEIRADDGSQACHVIPVFGHTFNEDTWAPGADLLYFPLRKATKCLTSGAWVSMFVGHDDNAGSNYCIPQHYMEPHRLCRDADGHPLLDERGKPVACRQQGGSVFYAITTAPSGVAADPIGAEAIAAHYLLAVLSEIPDKFSGWHERWQQRLARKVEGELHVRPPERTILRTTLITGDNYCRHLSLVRGWNGKRIPDNIAELLSPLSGDRFWIVEVSIPELYSANRRKVGEVLIRADVPVKPEGTGSFLLARLPGCFVFPESSNDSGRDDAGASASYIYIPSDIDDHVELFGCEELGEGGVNNPPPL